MKLSPREEELYALFFERDHDIPIVTLHDRLYEGSSKLDSRYAQARLGPVISRINRKLIKERIVPGDRKRTYRLVRIES